ncbi:MAG TPA: cytochrome c oxidase subunit II [Gemmatimonadales bacterium]|nr:cytochrome c oxidase subunit II [Gemmatimonadales bacterium]
MHWWFPGNASSVGGKVDSLFYVILYITGAVFVLVEATLVVFLVRYRKRSGRTATYVEGSTRAEIIWTAIPALILVTLALVSQPLWSKIKDADTYPRDAAHLGLEAKQFEWHVTYPGPDGKLGTDDDFLKRDSIHLVVNRDYVLELTARDVVHSLFIPAFRLKQDLVPGMTIRMWIRPTRTGTFEMACSELCGLGHYRMRGVVVVHTPQEYAAWLVSQGEASAADSAAASAATAVPTPPPTDGKGAQ